MPAHVKPHASAVSLLESGEQRCIKAINNNNNNNNFHDSYFDYTFPHNDQQLLP